MNVRDEPHTLGRWLPERAAVAGERIAIDDRGVTITYSALDQRAAALAARLTAAGYGPGDRVVTVSGNSIDHVVAFFACARTGLVFVPLSWRLTAGELAALLERTAPALILVDDEYSALARDAVLRSGVAAPAAQLGTVGVEACVPQRCGTATPTRPVRDDDPLLVIYTSGSEAAPKGVVLTHANCFWTNLSLAGALQLTAEDTVLSVLPQFHVAGWNVQPLLAWWVGATVVLERTFSPGRVLQLIAERRVTAMMGVPTQYRMLAEDPAFAASRLDSLHAPLVGGATIGAELSRVWAARGIPLIQGYGLTEAGPNVLHLPAAEAAAHPDAVGRPYPHVETAVVDPASGLPLEGEATGELWVRGPGVFAGYLDDPDATARTMSAGWLRTGDLVQRDGAGVHRIVDRLKEIFITGGENVAPAEVERVLAAHPAVAEVAVVGAPDPVWGERGVAFVVRADAAPLSADELLAHARQHLAVFKLPSRVVFVDDLPRTTIHKVARSTLRARARAITEEDAHERR
ncbi:class I adenylate-forming enzyme family protein [Microbacterium sp.]|uniref:class I adenylate-forming enzyme family protein n=1 Tax=Microbacterium sp. TaxID=51671 RepID=UPI00373616E3